MDLIQEKKHTEVSFINAFTCNERQINFSKFGNNRMPSDGKETPECENYYFSRYEKIDGFFVLLIVS